MVVSMMRRWKCHFQKCARGDEVESHGLILPCVLSGKHHIGGRFGCEFVTGKSVSLILNPTSFSHGYEKNIPMHANTC
jgi:hypothetical protein